MTDVGRVLQNQVRGITGALIVSGVITLLTVEMWWLAWERPASHLIAYAAVGLVGVLGIARSSGFRIEEEDGDGESEDDETDAGGGPSGDATKYDPVRLAVSFAELVLQSVAAAIVVLAMYGVIDRSTPAHVVARMALLQVVPLGFGAALANRLLREMESEAEDSAEQQTLPENVAVFAVGAIFFSLPLAASVEMDLLAATTTWRNLAAILAVSVVTTYLILYELEFRGQSRRVTDDELGPLIHAGQACVVYAVGLVVAAVLLWGFDHLEFALAVDAQTVVVLSFPTSVGAASARVVL